MLTQFSILFYLYCAWENFPPTYRVYFNDELMTEREYIWNNDTQVLQENLPVIADVDIPHIIRIEQVKPQSGIFTVRDVQILPADKADVTVEIV